MFNEHELKSMPGVKHVERHHQCKVSSFMVTASLRAQINSQQDVKNLSVSKSGLKGDNRSRLSNSMDWMSETWRMAGSA